MGEIPARKRGDTMEEQRHYNAFISYRHLKSDQAVAEQVQNLLESYHPPKGVAEGKRIDRIFRDTTELPASRDLDDALQEALMHADFLILILSETTKESKWCMEELRRFKQAHGGRIDRILPVLVSGEPADVFPEELRYEQRSVHGPNGEDVTVRVEVEPVCADVRAESDRKRKRRLRTEFLRLAAPMLNVGYDDLYQRQRRRQRRIRSALTGGAFALLLLLVGVIGTAYLRVSASEKQIFRQMVLGHVEAGLRSAEAGKTGEALAYYAQALQEDPDNAMARSGALLLLQTQSWLYEKGEAEPEEEETVKPPGLLTALMELTSWPETGDGAFVFAGAGNVCVWMSDTDSCYVCSRTVDGYNNRSIPRAAPIIREDRALIAMQDDRDIAVFEWRGDTAKPGLKLCTLLSVTDTDTGRSDEQAIDPEDEATRIERSFLEEYYRPGLLRDEELELGPCTPHIWADPQNGWVIPVANTIWALNAESGRLDSKKTFSSYVLEAAQSPDFSGYAVATASRWSRGTRGNIVTSVNGYGTTMGESAEDSRYAFRSLCFDGSGRHLLWADAGLLQLLNAPALGPAAPALPISGIQKAGFTPAGEIRLETADGSLLYDAVGFACKSTREYAREDLVTLYNQRRDQVAEHLAEDHSVPESYRDFDSLENACAFDGGFAVLLPGGVVLVYLDGQEEPAAAVQLLHGDYVNNGLAVSPAGWLCAVSFSQTVSNLEEGKTSLWAVEVWNWRENCCLGEIGNNRRYGADQLGTPCFPEPNLLCFNETASVRTILLDGEAPDLVTVAALRELAGMTLDENQSLQNQTPHFAGKLGNWETLLQAYDPLS